MLGQVCVEVGGIRGEGEPDRVNEGMQVRWGEW